jgi:hypothetical protein
MLEGSVVALVWVVDVNDMRRLSWSVEELETLLFAGLDKEGEKGEGFAPLMPVMV